MSAEATTTPVKPAQANTDTDVPVPVQAQTEQPSAEHAEVPAHAANEQKENEIEKAKECCADGICTGACGKQ